MSISRLGAAVALSLLFASPLAAQGTKVAYIDTNAVWAEYAPAQEAQRVLNATLAGYQTELDVLRSELAQGFTEYQQQQISMTPDARQKREEELNALEMSLNERGQELQTQAEQRRLEVFAPISEAIRSVLEEIRVEGNYGLILDVTSNAIMVADPALDLTQQVLIRLQAGSGSEDGT